MTQETMNFWRQTTHIMSYFKEESLHRTKDRPTNFLSGFLEVRTHNPCHQRGFTNTTFRVATRAGSNRGVVFLGPHVHTKIDIP